MSEHSSAAALAELYSNPLFMEPCAAKALAEAIEAGKAMAFAFPVEEPEEPEEEDEASEVAVISVHGPLMARNTFFTQWLGMATYESISLAIDEALENPNVKSIVLDIDSPGGVVSGNFELCDKIRAAGKIKNVLGQSSGMAASAGYAILAACNEARVSESAIIGSVGTIIMHRDYSEMNAKLGIKVTAITSGERKADGYPDFPLSLEAKAELQNRIDALSAIFFSRVSEWRNLSVDKIKGMEARTFVGAEAVENGLADSIGSLESVIRGAMESSREGEGMADPKAKAAAPEVAAPEKAEAPVVDLRAVEEAKAAGVTEERARMVDIEEHMTAGHEALAATAKKEGWNVVKFLKAQAKGEQLSNKASLDALAAHEEEEEQAEPSTPTKIEKIPTTLAKEATDEEIDLVWNKTPKLAEEFSSKEAFMAIVKSEGFKN